MASDPRPAALPTVLNLLVADGAHRDPVGKFYLLGVFNAITAPNFPAQHRPCVIYGSFTDGRGEVELTLRIVCVQHEERPIAVAKFRLRFGGPLEVQELAIGTPPLTFPHPGEYRVQVVHGEDILEERLLIVHQAGN